MSEVFDPYHTWLGIPPEEQPPNLYQLLGIRLFEDKPDVIANAADQRLAFLHTFQSGRNGMASQRLMNEVAAAQVQLLNPQGKAAYDVQLRQAIAAASAEETLDDTLASFIAEKDLETVGQSAARRSRLWSMLSAVLGGIAVLAVIGLVVWGLLSRRTLSPEGKPDVELAEGTRKPVKAKVSPKPKTTAKPSAVANDQPKPRPHRLKAEPPVKPLAAVVAQPPTPAASATAQPAAPEAPVSPLEAAIAASTSGNMEKPLPPLQQAIGAGSGTNSEPLPPLQSSVGPALPGSAAAEAEAKLKVPVPPADVQEKIGKQVDKLYSVAKVTTASAKLTLADELINVGGESSAKPEDQFVLWRRAVDLASDGGDAAMALKAARRIAEVFQVDPISAQAKVLSNFAARPADAARLKSLLAEYDGVVQAALGVDKFDAAIALVDAVQQACLHSPAGGAYRKRLAERHSELMRLRASFEQVQTALATLKDKPNDPAAVREAARWYCFQLGDWQRGLPYLVKANEPGALAIAVRELQVDTNKPEDQMAVADAWWDWSENQEKGVKTKVRQHVAKQYLELLPDAEGLQKARLKQRLAEVDPNALSGTFETLPGDRPGAKNPHARRGKPVPAQ